jgi:hypothetical protein
LLSEFVRRLEGRTGAGNLTGWCLDQLQIGYEAMRGGQELRTLAVTAPKTQTFTAAPPLGTGWISQSRAATWQTR